MYTCLLDASKAFDRVNNWTLFRQLLNQGVSVLLYRGILSPYLFIVYIDDLSNMLNSAGIGCLIHNCCTNVVFYVDDLCVIAPNPSGLQGLLNIYEKYGVENDVEYNHTKPLCMVLKPRGFNIYELTRA